VMVTDFLKDTEQARARRDERGVPALLKAWRGLGVEGWRDASLTGKIQSNESCSRDRLAQRSGSAAIGGDR